MNYECTGWKTGLDTDKIQAAMDDCNAKEGIVPVPPGQFLSGSPCCPDLNPDGIFAGADEGFDFPIKEAAVGWKTAASCAAA